MDFFAPYMDRIAELCRKHKVRSLHAFGSAAKGTIGPQSDVDLVVDIPIDDPLEYGEHYFDLLFGLEEVFERQVDLLEKKTLRNRFLQRSIETTKQHLYAA